MEDSKLIPDENNSNESFSDLTKENNKEEDVKELTESQETVIKEDFSEKKANLDLMEEKLENKKNSFFKRIINDGFDGISSNPNYKMLALLIILLINLSLFFVIGNIGKAFLRNAGIMG